MPTLDHFKKDAKRWLRALRSDDVSARTRLARVYPNSATLAVLLAGVA